MKPELNIHQQKIADLHPNLVTNDENFDNGTATIYTDLETEFAGIGDKFKEFREDLRLDKENADILKAVDTFTQKMTEHLTRPLAEISVEENELSKRVAESLSLPDNDQLGYMRAKRDLDELSTLTPAELQEVFKDHASRGSERPFKALGLMFKPDKLLSAPFLQIMKENYINARFSADTAKIAQLREQTAFITKVKQAIPHALAKIAKSKNIDYESALKARDQAHNEKLRGRSMNDKLKAIKDKGGFLGFKSEYKGEI